jgi:predicted nucleotide-binding protein
MDKPRIFLGSSGKQEKLLQALTRGLSDIARVEPWMTSFNPGTSTLERLLELTQEVDFAAFIFAQDDWTTGSPSASSQLEPGQASPRDNVVFEAGLFGGVLGMRRTFILHASGAKLPTDLLGLTCVRYADTLTPSEMRTATRKFATQSRTNFALLVSTAHGGLVDGAHRKGAFCSKPLEDFARSQWRA